MEIISGIHQVNGIRGANCYLCTGRAKMLVVDTGLPCNGKKSINYVKALGKDPSDIDYVILTHADIDHVGSTAELKKMTGGKLAIHTYDALILSVKSGFKTIRGPLGILFKLATPLTRFHPAEPDVILRNGSEVNGFKIVYTPGHTNGSVCLYLPGKVIFVGDALRNDSHGNPRPPSKNLSADIANVKASLIAISELDFDILLPGQGSPVIGEASRKVGELLTYFQ
jgi:hydroxyacylglutathione hydrolase